MTLRFCNDNCKEAYKADRENGLVYPPVVPVPDPGEVMVIPGHIERMELSNGLIAISHEAFSVRSTDSARTAQRS